MENKKTLGLHCTLNLNIPVHSLLGKSVAGLASPHGIAEFSRCAEFGADELVVGSQVFENVVLEVWRERLCATRSSRVSAISVDSADELTWSIHDLRCRDQVERLVHESVVDLIDRRRSIARGTLSGACMHASVFPAEPFVAV